MSESERRWRVYRVTIDTNIFFRSVIRKQNLANHLLSLWHHRRFVLVLSQAILDETQAVLLRPHLMDKYSYTLQSVTRLINFLEQRATIVEPSFSHGLCRRRDVDDDPVADCAIWGRAQFLVSYDNDFLENPTLKQALFEYGVHIVDPHTFVERIQE